MSTGVRGSNSEVNQNINPNIANTASDRGETPTKPSSSSRMQHKKANVAVPQSKVSMAQISASLNEIASYLNYDQGEIKRLMNLKHA